DPLHTAKLSVTRVPGSDSVRITLCDRCLVAEEGVQEDVLLHEVNRLDAASLAELLGWVDEQRRVRTQLEIIWARYRRLPPGSRERVRQHLARLSRVGGAGGSRLS